jgi:hypothetical protein
MNFPSPFATQGSPTRGSSALTNTDVQDNGRSAARELAITYIQIQLIAEHVAMHVPRAGPVALAHARI